MSKHIYNIYLADKTAKHIGCFEVDHAKYDTTGNRNIGNLISGKLTFCVEGQEGKQETFFGWYSRLADNDDSYPLGVVVRYGSDTRLENVGSFVIRLMSDTSALVTVNGEMRLCKVVRISDTGSVCATLWNTNGTAYVHLNVQYESYDTNDSIRSDYYYSPEEYNSLREEWDVLKDVLADDRLGESTRYTISGQSAMTLITSLKGEANPPMGCF